MGDVNTHLSRSCRQERPNNRSTYFNALLRENNMVSIISVVGGGGGIQLSLHTMVGMNL